MTPPPPQTFSSPSCRGPKGMENGGLGAEFPARAAAAAVPAAWGARPARRHDALGAHQARGEIRRGVSTRRPAPRSRRLPPAARRSRAGDAAGLRGTPAGGRGWGAPGAGGSESASPAPAPAQPGAGHCPLRPRGARRPRARARLQAGRAGHTRGGGRVVSLPGCPRPTSSSRASTPAAEPSRRPGPPPELVGPALPPRSLRFAGPGREARSLSACLSAFRTELCSPSGAPGGQFQVAAIKAKTCAVPQWGARARPGRAHQIALPPATWWPRLDSAGPSQRSGQALLCPRDPGGAG